MTVSKRNAPDVVSGLYNMPFHLRESGPSRPPSPAPPLDDLPGYQYSPMPISAHDEGSHAFDHPATIPPSPYEMPAPVPTTGHSVVPLEIVLPSDQVVFRGVGQDVESALLSGHIILNLTEATNIREITLQLTGKVKIQLPELSHARQSHHSHVLYTHDWSFLEGERNHKHTIKAGQHVFPFQVQLPNTLPVSCRTYSGAASIAYKLRATAVRSAFSANFHAFQSVHLMRSFSPEAMEYNQTLEIENTWPGKIMYSFVVPHKAFAAGDDIPVLVKFQPMAKGVSVQSVTTTIKEYTSIRWRGTQHQDTRTVSTARHEIRNGRAVLADPFGRTGSVPQLSTPSALRSRTSSYMNVLNGHSRSGTSASATSAHSNGDVIGHAISRLHAVSSGVAMAAGIGSAPQSASGSAEGHDAQPVASTSRLTDSPVEETAEQEAGDDEVDTSLHITLPGSTSPSSTIEPILSLYKIKFSVIISNLDGHTSELRCALPIHVMDPRLGEEVRLATNATHNLLFGSENAEETQNIDLPSYQAHVLDRIAVADVSQPTRTISNPLSRASSSANLAGLASAASNAHNRSGSGGGYFHGRSSGSATPGVSVPNSPGPSVPLDAVDSELLMSLGGVQASGPPSSTNTPPESRRESRAGSRVTSRAGSRANSRASSPERGHHSHGGIDGHKLAGALHSNRSSFFHLPSAMKPFTPFTKTRHAFSHHGSHSATPGSTSGTHTPASGSGSGSHTPHSPGEGTSTSSVSALSRVPDYSVASRGFLGGGVTPLSRDLPSYDQAQQQSNSTGDLVGLGRAQAHDTESEAGPSGIHTRPDVGRRSTSDLIFMRAGGAIPATMPSPSTSGTEPVR